MHHQCASLQGVIHFCGMETERCHITLIQYRLPIYFHTKGMSSIIDDFQIILIGNILNTFHVTRFAVAVHRHNSRCVWRYSCLNSIWINSAIGWVNIHEDRFATIPPYGMGCCNKTVWCRDDFTSNTQCLQCGQQWQGTISEKTDIRHLQVFAQSRLQLLMETAVIGNPLAVPNLLQESMKLIQVWK